MTYSTNQGRDIDKAFAAVAVPDIEDVARMAIWPEVRSHPDEASCFCPAVEAIARLQELGYTITKTSTPEEDAARIEKERRAWLASLKP